MTLALAAGATTSLLDSDSSGAALSYGQAVTFTATCTAPPSGVTGSVNFMAGGTSLGTVAVTAATAVGTACHFNGSSYFDLARCWD